MRQTTLLGVCGVIVPVAIPGMFALPAAILLALPWRASAAEATPSNDAPAARRPLHPGWSAVMTEGGRIRCLTAKANQWDRGAMDDLRGFNAIELLDLSGTIAGDEEMKAVAPLASLKTLLLPATRITDAAAVHLARLKELNTLDLSDTVISDAGLEELHGLRKLKSLITHRSRVTEKGLESFEAALPGFEAVRSWDVSLEEFDHGELMRTPRCNLIFDAPYMRAGWKATGQFQLSGPLWKPAQKRSVTSLSTFGPKRLPEDSVPAAVGSVRERMARQVAADIMKRPAAERAPSLLWIQGSSVEVGNAVLKTRGPWRTYLLDGRGNARLADFNLRWDPSRGMWIETPRNPDAVAQPEAGSRSVQDPSEKSYDASGSSNGEGSHFYTASGDWKGKLVWETGYCTPSPGTADLFRFWDNRSDWGLAIVFLHVPGENHGLPTQGGLMARLSQGQASFAYCLGRNKGLFGQYEPKGSTAERDRFGSGYRVDIIIARKAHDAPVIGSMIPRQEPSDNPTTFVLYPELWIEKRGTELVVPVTRDRKTKRIEYTDMIGRRHVIEEQRIDLTGPTKTIVLDVYRRARVLSPVDADRVLRTRLRDYLDDGDPSPAGPVARVVRAEQR